MAERSEAVEEQAVRDASAGYLVEAGIASAEDVPPGYKRTEVGVIPEDWEVKHLSELGVTYAGLTYKPSNVRSFGSLVLRSSNIQDGKLVFNSDDVYVDATIPPRAIVREGDILICVRNGSARLIGKCARIPKSAAGNAFGAFMTVFRANDDGLSFYLFQSDIVQRQIQERMGATINQITGKDLSEFLVPVPTAEGEQRAIATALSDADALIESLDRLIAKKRAIKQAAMQQLLTGQTRLPGFTGEWETKLLGELLTVRHGRNQSEVEQYDGKYPILATGGEIGKTDTALYDKPSVLIGRKGTIDQPRYMDSPFWTVDTLFYTEMHPSAHAKFMYYLFSQIPWREYNEASGVPSLNGKTIENIQVLAPHVEEQTAIAAVLSDMDSEIEAVEHRRYKARQIKQGMMQQLLTGRVRLVEPESSKEATA